MTHSKEIRDILVKKHCSFDSPNYVNFLIFFSNSFQKNLIDSVFSETTLEKYFALSS